MLGKANAKRLWKDERGNVLLIVAAVMPLLIGAAGMAVDTIQLNYWRNQLQRAADSSAIAGAYSLTQNRTATAGVQTDLNQNVFQTLSTAQTVTVGPSGGFQQAVRVQLNVRRTPAFMSIFVSTPFEINAESTAALVQQGTFCVLSLYDGTATGIDVGGNADVNLGCGMASNSRSAQAVTATGSSSVTASPIMAVGNLNGANNNFASGTELQPHSAQQADPFAALPNPAALSGCTTIRVQPNDARTTLSPNTCYNSLSISGPVSFQPGTYYVNGDISFGAQAEVTGSGVTFVMTGPNGAAGDLSMNGQAALNLTAPTSGTYQNVLFYRDRRAANVEIKINGGSDMAIQGALYFPTSDVTITGGAGFQTRCLQIIGQILRFRGNSNIENSCPQGGSAASFRLNYVRLID